MQKFERYVVGSGETEGYKALKATIPEDDIYMHYRLDGNCLEHCEDNYFVIHEDGVALCRIWMCYPRHKNSVCNWGAVYTLEECRGQGLCSKALEFCFDEVNKMENPPMGLFCTAGNQWKADMYIRHGFTLAIRGTTLGPLYYPIGDSPKTFKELYEQYYTPAKSLRAIKATWEWRNEIDCFLNFAMRDNGLDYAINGTRDLYAMLLNGTDKDVKVILTDEDKCVGWMIDGVAKVYPLYENLVNSITIE